PVGFIDVEVAKVKRVAVGAKIEHIEPVMKEGADFKALGVDDRAGVYRLLPFSVGVADGIVNIREAKATKAIRCEEQRVAVMRQGRMRVPRRRIDVRSEVPGIPPRSVFKAIRHEEVAVTLRIRRVAARKEQHTAIVAEAGGSFVIDRVDGCEFAGFRPAIS